MVPSGNGAPNALMAHVLKLMLLMSISAVVENKTDASNLRLKAERQI